MLEDSPLETSNEIQRVKQENLYLRDLLSWYGISFGKPKESVDQLFESLDHNETPNKSMDVSLMSDRLLIPRSSLHEIKSEVEALKRDILLARAEVIYMSEMVKVSLLLF